MKKRGHRRTCHHGILKRAPNRGGKHTQLKQVVALLFILVLGYSLPAAWSDNPPFGPGTHKLTFRVQDVQRTSIVHIPKSYRPSEPAPLVVMLHGGGGSGRAALWESGWADKAEKEGFLVLFPDALPPNPSLPGHFSRNPQLWNDGSDRFFPAQKAPDDVAFLVALLNELFRMFSIDSGRVFFTGFSNGASMCFLAAARMPERVAAIAPVAGALWFDPPKLYPPVSLLYLTGTEDPLNPLLGGVPRLATGFSDPIRGKAKPPVLDSVRKWAKALQCPETPKILEEQGLRTEIYGPGLQGSEAMYIAVDGLGHVWPGGRSLLPVSLVGKPNDRIRAVDRIWDFFKKHGRRGHP